MSLILLLSPRGCLHACVCVSTLAPSLAPRPVCHTSRSGLVVVLLCSVFRSYSSATNQGSVCPTLTSIGYYATAGSSVQTICPAVRTVLRHFSRLVCSWCSSGCWRAWCSCLIPLAFRGVPSLGSAPLFCRVGPILNLSLDGTQGRYGGQQGLMNSSCSGNWSVLLALLRDLPLRPLSCARCGCPVLGCVRCLLSTVGLLSWARLCDSDDALFGTALTDSSIVCIRARWRSLQGYYCVQGSTVKNPAPCPAVSFPLPLLQSCLLAAVW